MKVGYNLKVAPSKNSWKLTGAIVNSSCRIHVKSGRQMQVSHRSAAAESSPSDSAFDRRPDRSMNDKVRPFLSASDSRPACSAFDSNLSCSTLSFTRHVSGCLKQILGFCHGNTRKSQVMIRCGDRGAVGAPGEEGWCRTGCSNLPGTESLSFLSKGCDGLELHTSVAHQQLYLPVSLRL